AFYTPVQNASGIQAQLYSTGAAGNLTLNALGGNVGIGTTTPNAALEVYLSSGGNLPRITSGDNYAGLLLYKGLTQKASFAFANSADQFGTGSVADDVIISNNSSANSIHLATGVGPTVRLTVTSAGNVGIGTTTISSKFAVAVSGSVYGYVNNSNGAWANVSDSRLKKNITTMGDSAMGRINLLRSIYYDPLSASTTEGIRGANLGFIAQEMENIVPEVVSTDNNGYKAISYGSFAPLFVKALQEISASSSELNLKINGITAGLFTAPVRAPYFVSTSTTASTFSYASSTSITVSGKAYLGTTSISSLIVSDSGVRFSAYGAGTLQTDAVGNITVASDERLKDIQGSFSRGLADLRKIDPIVYKWKPETGYDTASAYAGFAAQNMLTAIPEAVGMGQDGFYTLQERPILAALVNAVKELDSSTTALQTRLDNINSFSTTSADYWKSVNDMFSTSSTNYWKSVTDLFSTTSSQYFINSSSTIPKTYVTNVFTAPQTVSATLSAGTTTMNSLIVTNTSTSTLSGDLSIAGLISLSRLAVSNSFFQAGLGNCNLKTDSLKYNSSTGKFTCDNNGGPTTYYFVDNDATKPATAVNNTTDYWSPATQPNITASSTGASILVSVNTSFTSTNAGSNYYVSRIVRNTGSPASCFTSGAVGSNMTAFSTDSGNVVNATQTFLDKPNTTNTTYYTVCSSALGTTGATVGSTTVTLVQLGGADLAENYYTTDDSIEAGDLVSIDETLPAGVKKTDISYDNVLGVISTEPNMVFDDNAGQDSGRRVAVALSGRVPVKVSIENGDISAGDYLTSSSFPGVAMKAVKSGMVIGQAMNNYSGESTGIVLMFIKNSFFRGEDLAMVGETKSSVFIATSTSIASMFNYASTTALTVSGNSYFSSTTFSGNVGIGTTSPNQKLVVQGGLCVTGGTSCPIETDGVIVAEGLITQNAFDLAENYPTFDTELDKGDIVSVDTSNNINIKKASSGEVSIGIISSAPGLTLGLRSTSTRPVALGGRVPVKVNLENGLISSGDRIAISSTPGVGMKMSNTSTQSVGIALESFNNEPTKNGMITVFVDLSWNNLDNSIANGKINADLWTSDSNTGVIKLASASILDMQSKDIINIGKLISSSGRWSINESGKLIVDEIEANKIKVEMGVTVKDRSNNGYYCIYFDSGIMKSEPGECQASVSNAITGSSQNSTPTSNSSSSSDVIDTIPPVIILNGLNPSTINTGSTYSDMGAVVTDNVDQNLGYGVSTYVGDTLVSDHEVVIDTNTPSTYTIKYNAFDSANNQAVEISRTVIVNSPSYNPTGNETSSSTQMTELPE
ncbi:MAG: tail fiber domain-containing protein, partial [Bacteroidota bacterium]